MASKEFNAVGILYPKKGKTDEVIGLLQEMAEYVKEKEPFVLKYDINRSLRPNKDGTEDIIMLERYQDSQGMKIHGTSEAFAAFQKKVGERDLMRAPMMLKTVSSQGGFSSRL